jgi:hypothetical protein
MSEADDVKPRLDDLQQIADMLSRHEEGNIAIVLVGSAARGVWSEASDIDLLVVRENPAKPVKSVSGYHIQTATEADFVRNLSDGEDFEAWCVRLGKTLHDDGIWTRIKSSPAAATWPKWQVKVKHGARRLLLAKMLLVTGDKDAAAEETLYTLGHIARAILLREGVFPFSRPELAEQISKIGFVHLADLHEQLRTDSDVPLQTVRLAQLYAKKLLCHLDPKTYGKYASDYRLIRTTKTAKHAARFSTS